VDFVISCPPYRGGQAFLREGHAPLNQARGGPGPPGLPP